MEKIKTQVCRFIDFDIGEASAEVVNNLDWTANLDVLTFLRYRQTFFHQFDDPEGIGQAAYRARG